jgi:hypothetical protein
MRQIRGVLRQRFVSELPQRALSQGAVSGYLSLARGAGVSWPLLEDLDDEQLEALVCRRLSLGNQPFYGLTVSKQREH